ncbi:type I restriction-modification system subunit M [Enterococcus cecorum]|uniref:type I restriction-modification system subunit M n=1 Tax=Enterococcus cecorum TaxID=44008 RepID=UPI00064334D3|nr:class I SAM-dependent DNA methyltransferase [Enterococcus cecorum]KLO69109.1 N-6 DNA methylase [Enterococcus cecorum]CAI3299032.1 SAM-dependent DNA methyltransferase [Enterococcus cecorum]CAI3332970.1 SAM-dependent DNA methyltransferase [Enterococcus cecorum]CAI3350120.1 SAM-dependent DNA methyltransferase [Enterococcus cecorum]CAI3469791.1 SAM-dependent DNA methyltransferase [Enterococcus cecorum]
MDNQTYNSIVNFIWGIADDCLRDVYVRGKYRDVILPMTVIRRLDAVLEETKPAVLEMKKKLDDAGITNQTAALCNAAGQSFCNSSPFCLRDLTSRAKKQTLKADFIAYLDGFSPNVQEILDKFKFRNQIDTMIDADILGAVIEKFVSPTINLSPNPVYKDDEKKEIRLPGLDNHTMGVIFEELIRRFNEENNEEAGEHFTPRDVVELMADLIFVPVADKIKDATYSCYDGACGTGGMLTVAQDRLMELAEKAGKKVSIHLFGQEINPETYAIAKSDLLLQGQGDQADHIGFGSTLSNDQFPTYQFDFMLSNPPYGKSWKVDADKLGGKKDIMDSRFVTNFADAPNFSMIPRTSDGQLLFLLNNVAKMKKTTELGSRIAEVHNGSSLFTGDAGQGESNARRYMIENDLVEAIIALPDNMFYNTGIGTFIWILSNNKAEHRKGKIQLIDATSLKSSLRKNLGKKNCEFTSEIRRQILDLYMAFEENEYSKIFDNNEFGYWKVTVLRPAYNEDGSIQKYKKGKPVVNKELTDTEQIPFTYEGGIETFFEKEVKPFAPDAWIDEKQTKIGYEISFTKYFYKSIQLRTLEEITADIRSLEEETDGLLAEIIGG